MLTVSVNASDVYVESNQNYVFDALGYEWGIWYIKTTVNEDVSDMVVVYLGPFGEISSDKISPVSLLLITTLISALICIVIIFIFKMYRHKKKQMQVSED